MAVPPERFAALAELLRVCNREDYLKLRATLYNNLSIILVALDIAADEEPAASDYYASDNTVRIGRYPGRVISVHASHPEAVQEMLRLNEANGMDDREDKPREEFP